MWHDSDKNNQLLLILVKPCVILGWEAGKPDGYYYIKKDGNENWVNKINSGNVAYLSISPAFLLIDINDKLLTHSAIMLTHPLHCGISKD